MVTTRRYSPEIGTVLAEVRGATPRYQLKGDEIYVRATVVSSKLKSNRLRSAITKPPGFSPWCLNSTARDMPFNMAREVAAIWVYYFRPLMAA